MLPAGISKFDQVLANHGQLARVAGIRSFTVRELDGSGAFGVKGNLTPIKESGAVTGKIRCFGQVDRLAVHSND